MEKYTYASEVFLNELLRISTGIVWKNSIKALENEDSSNMIQIEQYQLAYQGRLTYDLVYQFNKEALVQSGLSDDLASQATNDPTVIPKELRDICAKNQTEYTLNHYIEQNEYYRELNGLPPLTDTDFVYNTKYPDISDTDTPLHLLDTDQLMLLENNGYLDEVISLYPDKKYLSHLTSKKIDIYTARNSDPYAILWMQSSDYQTLVTDFKEIYNSCRYMVDSIFASRTIQEQNSSYAGFTALTILFTTIQQMHRKFLDADITRDFYDEDSLKYVYDSYGVPYYSAIPLEYHKKIVKNINRLISYKGSTNVIYELFDIFGVSDMSVFEFYMMKIHKFENGKPLFIKDENGKYDLQKMYDVKFAKVRLYDDPVSDIIQPKNQIKYNDMVDGDPYWISDEELINKLYSEEYNYLASKYLGIQTSFNLMKIMYESSYYLKMIIDNRTLLSATTIYNNNIKDYCNIFDIIIYACALICKRYGYAGNIPNKPHEIGKVMGFNFKDDLIVLKANVSKDPYLSKDSSLLKYIETMSVYSLDSIYNIYENLTDLKRYLTLKMADASEIDEYWAYYELYNTILYSEYIDSTFSKSDGTTAESFADLLHDINSALYDRLEIDTSIDEDVELSDVLYLIKNSCKALENIQYMDDVNINLIIEYLFKLADFFKSAKSDLTGYEIVYSLVSRSENIMKIMDRIDHYVELGMHIDDIIDEFTDVIISIGDLTKLKQNIITYIDDFHGNVIEKQHYYSAIDKLNDKITKLAEITKPFNELYNLGDYIHNYRDIFLAKDHSFGFSDSLTLVYENIENE